MNDVLSHALIYADMGWPIYPVVGKIPVTDRGKNDATTNKDQIIEWLAGSSILGIAMPTGGNVAVLDIEHDALDFHAKYKWPRTVSARSGGGGIHLYFRTNVPVRGLIGLFRRVDFLAEGNSVILPPSKHEKGNYEWIENPVKTSLAMLPAWILQAAEDNRKSRKEYGDKIVRHEKDLSRVPVMPHGVRNDQIFRLTCRLICEKKSEPEIMKLIGEVNATKSNPPLSPREISSLVRSAYRRYRAV